MPSRIITFLLFVGFGLIPMEICASILTGNMWVMDNATGNEDGRILTITPAGEAAVAITAAEIDAARTAANDEFPEGMGVRFTDNDIVFDNYGNFYFTESVSDGLFRLNEKTGLVQLVKESDILALTQNDDPNLYKAKPEKLAAGSGNMLYVTEKESGSILAVDRVTGSVSVLVSQTDFTNSLAVEEIKLSGGIALSPDETRLYVVNDFGDDSLIKVDISGQTPVITELVSEADFPTGEADLERFITTAPNGDIILVDEETEDIFRVTPSGSLSIFLAETLIEELVGGDNPESDYDPEAGIDFDLDGNFFLAQRESPSSILKWTALDPLAGTIHSDSGVIFATQATILEDIDMLGNSVDFTGGFTFVPTIATDPRTVPEPTAIVIWILLGCAGSTISWYQRKR